MPAPEPQAEPLPTLADLAAHHRDEAAAYRSKAEELEAQGYQGGIVHKPRAEAAWHEAAARMLDDLAAQGRIRANVLRNIAENSAGDLGKLSHNQLVWKVDMIRRLVLATLAAPPAEEPR